MPVPSPRSLLARYGVVPGLAFDLVAFSAGCPACGGEAQWVQQREDTRLRTEISCPSPGCR